MGNSGMIAGAFSSVSGKADTVLTTNGDVLYYNSGRQRLAIGSEDQVLSVSSSGLPEWAAASGGANTALSNLSSVSVNATIDMNTQNLTNTQFLGCKIFAEQTISSGAITFTQSLTSIDTEADASTDDLDSWNGLTNGFFMLVKSENNARDPTLRNGVTGSTKANLAGAFTLADYDYRCFLSTWIQNNFAVQEISRSENSS